MTLSNGIQAVKGTDPYVFIVENIDSPIMHVQQNTQQAKKYEYIATVAIFDVVNENGRKYQRDDYLRFIPSLKDKISKGQLMGELDHPQSYDTSLKNVSHIVTDVWYEKSDNTVKIKFEILDTPYGRIAKILIDAGVQLSVSSRSAGKVDGGGVVNLFKIFTYDLVAEPGFAQALIQPVMPTKIQENFSILNESLDMMRETTITNKLELLCESQFFGTNAKIYKVNESDLNSFEKSLNKFNMNITKNNSDGMISESQFEEYTKMVSKQFESLQTLILEKNAQAQAQAQAAQAQAQAQPAQAQPAQAQAQSQAQPAQAQAQAQSVQAQYAQAQVQAQPIDMVQPVLPFQAQPTQALAQPMAQPNAMNTTQGIPNGLPTVQHGDSNQEVVQKLIQYINFLAKQIEVVMTHSNVVTEMLNRSINYTETIGGTLNEHINYTNMQNKLMNESIKYAEELADVINTNGMITEKTVKYIDLLGKRLNESIQYGNIVADRTEKAIKFSEFNANLFNEHVDFTNSLANHINSEDFKVGKLDGVSDRNIQANIAGINESASKVLTDVNKTITLINERSNTSVLEGLYPFLKLLTESNKNTFFGLDDNTKAEVVATLQAGVYFNEGDVMTVMHGVLESKKHGMPTYMKFMPDKYKKVYESMNDVEKTEIHRKANSGFYRMNTPYQVKTFWDSMQLSERVKLMENQQTQNTEQQTVINESVSQSKEGISREQFTEYTRGYSLDYISQLTRHASMHK